MRFIKQLQEDVNVVFERDPAARNVLEVILTYPGVHAIVFHRLAHALWLRRFHGLARFIAALSRFLTGIEIHPGAYIGRRFFIDHGMGVVIGETAQIGNDCTLYHGVTLGGTTWQKGKRHPTLGNNVIVGAGAKILGPITVGDNSRIGSNAVVVKEVPADATVIGIPGRVVRREGRVNRLGFDAYAATEQMPDPVARAIECMLDHMHKQDEQIEALQNALTSVAQVGAPAPAAPEPFACPLEDEPTETVRGEKMGTNT
ncbi:MAG: serine O-acetyltransferase [Pseudomonadota bacterium]|uniref:serine O-acetyltransferase n=1 Tax=Thermithiobacillus tepidarius TaxID=929 RepID=UPI0003FFF426|nr:serine O-acetyltransferase [Thermithiobacillus tepidarius]